MRPRRLTRREKLALVASAPVRGDDERANAAVREVTNPINSVFHGVDNDR